MKRILLIHGIWECRANMWWLASALRRAGFAAETWGYQSISTDSHISLAHLRKQLQQQNYFGIVAHSLGGLMALNAIEQLPQTSVQRVVCLGSPLLSSGVARQMVQKRIGWGLGKSRDILCRGLTRWQHPAEVGSIAGTLSPGLGQLLAHVPRPSDGTVSVAETRLPGITDHCTVAASHLSLLVSGQAARQTIHFLHHSCFILRRSPSAAVSEP